MRDFAERFYKGPAWRSCRDSYVKYAGGLCESCLRRGLYVGGEIVHHKIHLTPENIKDPSIALSFDNLELLCRECHALEHSTRRRRFTVDKEGRVTAREDSPPIR